HQLIDKIRVASPRTSVVYDTVDLHHVREARRLRLEGEEPGTDFVEVRGVERLIINRSDLVATVSVEEAGIVRAFVPGAPTVVLPNVHERVAGELPGFDQRSGLLFIGGFQHPPNVDAMLWFVQEILPAINDRIPAHLTILGSDPPKEVQSLASRDVTVTGYVSEVYEYFRRARGFGEACAYVSGDRGMVGRG